MKKWKKKTKAIVLIIFLLFLVLFAALCWKKRRGIYNTYMKLTGQEIPYSVIEKRKSAYGYYDQKLNVSMDIKMKRTEEILEMMLQQIRSKQRFQKRKHLFRLLIR